MKDTDVFDRLKKLTKDKKEAIIIEPDSYVKELENIRKIKILKKI